MNLTPNQQDKAEIEELKLILHRIARGHEDSVIRQERDKLAKELDEAKTNIYKLRLKHDDWVPAQ